MGRAFDTDAVVLRSFRYAEADRIVHLLTRDRGRVSALVRGARRTRSHLGGRLEPLSITTVSLVDGRGELCTVTGADLVRGPDALLAIPRRLDVALLGVGVVSRLFPEEVANGRLFDGLERFLSEAACLPAPTSSEGPPGPPGEDPLFLAFVLKLTSLAGFGLRLDACVHCGRRDDLVRVDASAGGAACSGCPGRPVASGSVEAGLALLRSPLRAGPTISPAAARDLLRTATDVLAGHAGVELERSVERSVESPGGL